MHETRVRELQHGKLTSSSGPALLASQQVLLQQKVSCSWLCLHETQRLCPFRHMSSYVSPVPVRWASVCVGIERVAASVETMAFTRLRRRPRKPGLLL